MSPYTDWLEGSGLTLDNGIVCDETLWTGVPGVYAAGDVANWLNPIVRRAATHGELDGGRRAGRAAARNALDPENAKPYGTVPYFWSDWYGSRIQFVGVPDADEVLVVDGDVDDDDRWTALYRRGDRLVGALTLNGQTVDHEVPQDDRAEELVGRRAGVRREAQGLGAGQGRRTRCMTSTHALFDRSSCLVDTRLFVQGREIVDGVEPASLISAEGEDL